MSLARYHDHTIHCRGKTKHSETLHKIYPEFLRKVKVKLVLQLIGLPSGVYPGFFYHGWEAIPSLDYPLSI